MKLTCESFFSNYIFHPFDANTNEEDRKTSNLQTLTAKIKQPKTPDEFKDELRFFFRSDREQAEAIISHAPVHFMAQDCVELVFDKCDPEVISCLLDAIQKNYPSFKLSPYDEIRKAICEDTSHLLTNGWLDEMIITLANQLNQKEIEAIYDLAFEINHPRIYSQADTAISVNDYVLNFLWVNLNPQNRDEDIAQNIFGKGLDESENAECLIDSMTLRGLEEREDKGILRGKELEHWKKIKESFTYKLIKWAEANPKAKMNLWYDSALVTKKAQQKTKEMLQAISESRGVNLQLRDVRQLSNLKGELEYALHPAVQVYFRVDLLKAMIADHIMESNEESTKYCIISDIDVEAMSAEQIFDKRTINYLSTNGFVFNRVGLKNFENSFYIFNKENAQLHQIHKETILQKTANHITALRKYHKNKVPDKVKVCDAQFVFNKYQKFLNKVNDLYRPRKIVKCPKSQFNHGGIFSDSDYRKESFRFIGENTIPHVLYGRNPKNQESKLKKLKNWSAEPLISR